MKPNRREFTAALGATAILASLPAVPALAQPAAEVPWYRRIKRIGQTNFNEKDPIGANVEQWADYWALAKVEALALSVSGPIAFYPTDVPFFRRCAYLNGRDLFGDCVKAAKARGIRVYGRMSPDVQWIDDPKLVEAHPLWFRRNQDGSLQMSAPGLAFTCQFSGHFSEQQPAILRELIERYPIDGIYMNGWPTAQACYCENCRKIGEPHTQAYRDALTRSAIQLIEQYKGIVTAKHPGNFYSCNLGGGLKEWGLDQWELTRNALWYTADNQGRDGVESPVWQDAQQVRFAQSLMHGRPVAAVTGSYSRTGKIMYRNVAEAPAEVESRLAQTSAAGGILWYHHLGLEQGFREDRRWQKTGRDFLSWHASHDKHFHNVQSLARVAIVASPRSIALYDAPSSEDKTDHLQGMYTALTEARIPFDYVHEQDLSAERLNRYALVILPNVALMSDAQTRALTQYGQQGGSLLATFETGLYDETGKARDNFSLASVFGIQKAGARAKAEYEPHQPIWGIHLQKIRSQSPITAGFEDTEWIAGPVWRVPLAPIASPTLMFIKPYPAYPTEAVYQREPPTDLPSVVLREQGESRFAYLAGDMDATYWRMDNPDLGRQLQNTITWLLRDRSDVSVTGEGLMEVFAWQTEPGFALHLLNYNGPNAFRGKMRKPITLGPQTVRMTLPNDAKIGKVSLLRAGSEIPFTQRGRMVSFTVPNVPAYEVVALEV